MCRFLLYMGPELTISSLVTEPTHSIIHQSTHSRERAEPLNGDGFGIGWYAPQFSPRAATFHSVSPAWNNTNLVEIARVTSSRCILAHIRAASPGLPVTLLNCHPFTHAEYTLVHNGNIARFRDIRRGLLASLSDEAFGAIMGSTDSEHLFAIFLDRVRACEGEGCEKLATALAATLRDVIEITRNDGETPESFLNVAVTDGHSAAVSRFTTSTTSDPESLYLNSGSHYICEKGVCRMIDPISGACAAIVASEPLSDEPGWISVPPGHIVLLPGDGTASTRPINDL